MALRVCLKAPMLLLHVAVKIAQPQVRLLPVALQALSPRNPIPLLDALSVPALSESTWQSVGFDLEEVDVGAVPFPQFL